MRTAFLILGAQRSGTSAVSHALSKLGVNFGNPQNFLQDRHNPIFFELRWVNQFNDRIINALGHQYIDFFLPIESDYETAIISTITGELPALIQQEWTSEPRIGIKDPRFSLTFPLWESALVAAGYDLKIIIAFRSPSDFLQSNQRLFHGWAGWDEARHLQFWLQFNLAAVYFARKYPIHFVHYNDLTSRPLHTVQQLADLFDLDQQQVPAGAAVIDKTYHHHKQSTEITDPTIAYYYDLLQSHTLSATDYLSYRNAAMAEHA